MYEKCKKCNGERILVINFNRYMCDECRATGFDLKHQKINSPFINDDEVAALGQHHAPKTITHESATASPKLTFSRRGRPPRAS